MNRPQFFEFAKSFYERAFQVMQNKNDDYSKKNNPFSNFELTAMIADVSVEQAFLMHIGGKVARLRECLEKPVVVLDEPLEDTLRDLANYSTLCAGYLKQTLDNAKKQL